MSPRAHLGLGLVLCALAGCSGGRGLSALDEQPAPGEARGFTPTAPLERRLSTGLTVWLLARPGLPLNTAYLLVPAGAAADPAERPGLAALCADMLDESTRTRSALELSSAFERLGAELALGAARDYAYVQLTVLSRYLDPALALLGEALSSPRFTPEDLERVRGIQLSELSQAMEDPPRLAARLLAPLAFGAAHPYGHPNEGSPAGLRAVTRDELEAFYRARWRPDQAVLVLAGDLDEPTSLALLESRLGGWRALPGDAPGPVAPGPLPATLARMWVVDLPGASQTSIALGVPGLRRADPELPLLALADSALGGTFTSRLNQNLREDKGYTYGAFSALAPGAGQGLWLMRTAVDGKATGGALRELLAELRRLQGGDLLPEELHKAQAAERTMVVETFTAQASAAGELAEAAFYGLGPLALARRLEEQARATPEILNALVRERLRPAELALVLVGDWQVIRPQLADLGLPEPVHVDAEGRALETAGP